MTQDSNYVHALRIWLEEHVSPPWTWYLQPTPFAKLVDEAQAAGFRFRPRTRLEQTLRRLLTEGS